MTAVDTGWINDENPFEKQVEIRATGFQTPIDEIDAAARILDPLMVRVRRGASTARRNVGPLQVGWSEGKNMCGIFLKDSSRLNGKAEHARRNAVQCNLYIYNDGNRRC